MFRRWPQPRYLLRRLTRQPGVSLVVVLSLALAIGANTAIFSFINAVFLKSLPVSEPDGVVSIFGTDASGNVPPGMTHLPVSYPNYLDLRQGNDTMADLAAHTWVFVNVDRGAGSPTRVVGQMVTGNFFDLLGVRAALGRTFPAGVDEALGANPVVVLSHRLWTREFGGDPGAVGRSVRLNGHPFTIIGVAPPEFKGPDSLAAFELWVPFSMYREVFPDPAIIEQRLWRIFYLMGRLKPGISAAEASADLTTLAGHLEQEYPDANKDRGLTLLPLAEASVDPNQRDLYVRSGTLLMGVVVLVLVIACANIANLLLARAIARRREMAIRRSLGADSGTLVRQLLAEGLALSLGGGLLGLLLGVWIRDLLWRLRPPFFTEGSLRLELDGRVLAFTFGVALLTGLAFSLIPALHAARADLLSNLKEGSRSSAGHRLPGLRHSFVVAQVALSLVALTATGLFVASLRNAQRIDPGFETENLLLLTLDPGSEGYSPAQARELFRRVEERVLAVPGVAAAGLAVNLPLNPTGISRTTLVEGADRAADEGGTLVRINAVTPGFFEAMGIPLVAGRSFGAEDGEETRAVAVVSRATVERLLGGGDALGRRLRFQDQEAAMEVVGVVEDIKYTSLGEAPQPHIYLPHGQSFAPAMHLHVRSEVPVETVVTPIRAAVQALDTNLPILDMRPIADVIGDSLWGPRLAAALFSILGMVALVLTAVGLYGVVAYSVSQRRQELGLRMSLGAGRSTILKLVLRQGMLIVGAGAVVGAILAFLANRVTASLLFGVDPTDPAVLLTSAAVLAGVAFLANLIPAARAMALDPVETLRVE